MHRSTATNRREIYAPFIAILCLAGFALGSFLCAPNGAALAFCKTRLRAADGVSNDKIIFGKVAALNGPALAFGQDISEGILAAFEDANRAGG